MTGGFIVVRYETVSSGLSDEVTCIVVCSLGILVNAEISVIEQNWFTTESYSWNGFVQY